MKKLFVLLTMVSMFLVSCGEKNNSLGNFDYDESTLVGTWKITEINDLEWPMENTTFRFGNEGTFLSEGYFGYLGGDYKLSGNKITVYSKGVVLMTLEVSALTSDTFVFDMIISSTSTKLKCIK